MRQFMDNANAIALQHITIMLQLITNLLSNVVNLCKLCQPKTISDIINDIHQNLY